MARDKSQDLKFRLQNSGFQGFGDTLNNPIGEMLGQQRWTPQDYLRGMMTTTAMQEGAKSDDATGGLLEYMFDRKKGDSGVYHGKDIQPGDDKFSDFTEGFFQRYWQDNRRALKDQGFENYEDWVSQGNRGQRGDFGLRWITDPNTGSEKPWLTIGDINRKDGQWTGGGKAVPADVFSDFEMLSKEEWEDSYSDIYGSHDNFGNEVEFGGKYHLLNEYLPYLISGKEWEDPSFVQKLFGYK